MGQPCVASSVEFGVCQKVRLRIVRMHLIPTGWLLLVSLLSGRSRRAQPTGQQPTGQSQHSAFSIKHSLNSTQRLRLLLISRNIRSVVPLCIISIKENKNSTEFLQPKNSFKAKIKKPEIYLHTYIK